MAQLEEVVDLELILTLTPLCEDDHEVAGSVYPPPPCATVAEAQLIYSKCSGEHILACRPLAEWCLEDPPAMCSQCASHGVSDCLKIVWL